MGGAHANVLQHVEDQFQAAAAGRQGDAAQESGKVGESTKEVWDRYDHMVDASKIHDLGWRRLYAMRQIEGLRLDFAHLGVLYALDVGRTGTFTLSGLQGFAHWCAAISAKGERAFAEEAQTQALLRLWKDHVTRAERGEDAFVEWLLDIVRHSSDGDDALPPGAMDPLFPDAAHPLHAPPSDPSTFTTSQLRVLYKLLGSDDTALDLSDFLQLCHMAHLEAQGLPAAPHTDADAPPVAIQVVRPFVRQFARSHFGNLSMLGLDPLLDAPPSAPA
eukprot:TRINITY_DN12082_c0_g1_i1.p1 TRINITY_DN12082_c0_g1~~TRINITY_DN12082_c0_g1_i1.p1  ORF type:complete len:275 (+),score=60.54 TRINITY_DN12082_c0_g1_i1:67-891(+)